MIVGEGLDIAGAYVHRAHLRLFSPVNGHVHMACHLGDVPSSKIRSCIDQYSDIINGSQESQLV